jgi:hypothetical protein
MFVSEHLVSSLGSYMSRCSQPAVYILPGSVPPRQINYDFDNAWLINKFTGEVMIIQSPR